MIRSNTSGGVLFPRGQSNQNRAPNPGFVPSSARPAPGAGGMAHTTRLINFTRDLKYSIVSAPAPLTLTVQKSLCTVLTSFCLKNHCRAEPMCTAAFTESFSLFLRRGRCPHRPLRKNPAPHKFPHITAKTRYFSIFPPKAKIPLFGFSHFSFRIAGQKCCFFVPSVNSAD